MKHGDKAKKSAKGKSSGKKAGRKVAPPRKTESKSRGSKVSKKAAPAKTSSIKPSGNGKAGARSGPVVVNFSNPVVAAAFKRAVKKYPSAFRRLTD